MASTTTLKTLVESLLEDSQMPPRLAAVDGLHGPLRYAVHRGHRSLLHSAFQQLANLKNHLFSQFRLRVSNATQNTSSASVGYPLFRASSFGGTVGVILALRASPQVVRVATSAIVATMQNAWRRVWDAPIRQDVRDAMCWCTLAAIGGLAVSVNGHAAQPRPTVGWGTFLNALQIKLGAPAFVSCDDALSHNSMIGARNG